MSRPERSTRRQTRPSRWNRALPVLCLALSAAVWAHGAAADAPSQASARRAAPADAHELPYALVRDGEHGMTMNGDGEDWSSVKRLGQRIHGDFLWFRDAGRAYVIQDPEVLAKARAAWAPVDRLGEQMDADGRAMDRQGKAMDALGRDMARSADGARPDAAKMRAIEAQMDELGRKIGDLAGQMADAGDAQRDQLNRQMAQLSARMGELGRQMGSVAQAGGQRQARLAMNDLGPRMDEASKPMDALGKRMDARGKEMARASHAADQAIRGLIRDAMARDLARAAPQG